jgi:hypothetical protein
MSIGIGEFLRVGQEIPTYQFVKNNNEILNLNETFLAQLEQESTKCGYETYMEKVCLLSRLDVIRC